MVWSIEPNDGVINNGDGSFTFPQNASITQYTITCDNGAGCTASTIYSIPQDCGGDPPPSPEPPGPGPGPGPGPEPGDTCDDFTWTDVGYSWCTASESPGTFCTAVCSSGNLEKNVSWGNIEEESDSFFTSFSEPVIETSDNGVEKWVFRGMVSAMNCDCSSRTCHVTINYTIKGTSKSHRATIIQRGWPKNAEHCP